MKHRSKWTAVLLCAALLLSACAAAEDTADGGETHQTSVNTTGTAVRTPAAPDLAGATAITLSGTGASVDGSGASEKDGVVTVTSGGVYTVSGSLEDGRILVNAPKEDVTLVLSGAKIACSYGSPLYVYKAGTATVYLAEGTENLLEDGAVYTYADEYSSAADEEPNACLYSKADLVIEGAGSLTVTANFDNGITSKDTLQIYDSTITVRAVDNGINGKDSNTIANASITVDCGGDAIRSTNDTDETLGWVSVSDSALELTAGEDGIQAETALTMSGGSCTVVSGGGSGVQPSDDASAKGLKAGTSLTLAGGTYVLDCSDDAIHSNGDVTVSDGVYTISTGDDALHADEALAVSGGEITVLASYEGLEGTSVAVSGGVVRITASDDGVNAAGGADGSGFGHGNTFGGNSDCRIDLSGGYLVVTAGGDGLDSNGSIAMSGGTVIACSTGYGDGALDYDGSFTLTGGTLLAVDGGGMSQIPSQAEQYTVALGVGEALPAGTFVSLEGEGQSIVFQLPSGGSNIVFSSPELAGGGTYTVSYGGDYSGACQDGLCSGGTYSGGAELTALTLEESITSYGGFGMGNMPGRPGGMGNGNMGGEPKGDHGGPPEDSTMPGTPPDGTMPDGGFPGGKFSDGEFPDGEFPNGEFPEDGMRGDMRDHGGRDGAPEEENGFAGKP